jgi:hypothetical protein
MPIWVFRTIQWLIKLQKRTFDEKRYILDLNMKVSILKLDYTERKCVIKLSNRSI